MSHKINGTVDARTDGDAVADQGSDALHHPPAHFTIVWNVDADGDWNTPGNWDQNRLPGASDNVDIDTADLHTVTFSSGSSTVHSLTVGNDDFIVSGGAFAVTNGATFANALTVAGGTLDFGANNGSVTGIFSQDSGTVSGTGKFTLAGGADFSGSAELMTGAGTTILQGTVNIESGDALNLDGGRILENQNSLAFTDGSAVVLGSNPFGAALGGATLKNDSGGVITFNFGTNTDAIQVGSGTTAFLNAGLVQNVGTAHTEIDAAFTNTGSVVVQSGELDVDAAMSGKGSVEVDSGAMFALNAASTTTANNVNVTSGTGVANLTGGSGDDVFAFAGNFQASDMVNGNGGNDTLVLKGDYSGGLTFGATTLTNVETISLAAGNSYNLTTNDANVAAGKTLTVDASALGKNDTLTFNGGAESNGTFVIKGGAGADVINMGAALVAGDAIDGGSGSDTVVLNGSYTGLVLAPTTIVNVETLSFVAGHNYKLTSDDGTVAAGKTLTVDGSALGASDVLNFNGAAELDGKFILNGGAGNDVLTGGAGNDTFNLATGGNDTTKGGAGNDTFNMGAALTASDKIDGGNDNDTVVLNGNYSGGLTFGATTMVNVETLSLTAGFSYNLTTNDATVAKSAKLTVDGSNLGAGDTFTFNGGAELDGVFVVNGGAGLDTLTGGAGKDVFNMGGFLTAADKIDGGAGADTLALNGDYSGGFVFGATTMVNVETLTLAAGHSYNLTTNDANVGAGQTLTIDAKKLGVSDVLTFNGMGETNGMFNIDGGDGNDVFNMGALLNTSDKLNGGKGVDTLVLNGDYSSGLNLKASTITNVETVALTAGHSYKLTTNDGNVGANKVLTIDGSTLGASDILTFNGSAELDGNFVVNAGLGKSTLTGGAGNDIFNMGGSLIASDKLDGGLGNDTVVLNGNYAAGLTFGAATMVNVEALTLTAGHSYKLTTNDATVAAGQTLTVDGSTLGAADAMTFSGAADLDGSFIVNGGAGLDTLTGGALGDVFNMGANLTAADKINGGAGADTLVLNGDYSAGLTFSSTTMVNVEAITLTKGFSYNLTTNDATVASGQTLTVDGSKLGASDALTFNASGETNGFFAITSGGGNDTFIFGGALKSADAIDGGNGSDTLSLNGNYSSAFTFGATTMVNVETISLAAGHSYNLTTDDANVAAGKTLTIDGSALGASDVLTFNGGGELDGKFVVNGGAANDVLTGGAGNDVFNLATGGNDTAIGGLGNDTFNMGAALTAADAIDGGGGTDKVVLSGDYSGGLTFGATTMVNVETLSLMAGFSYNLTTNDATVGAGQTMTVDGSSLGAADMLTLDVSAEMDGSFVLKGGAGNDTFLMGATLSIADKIDGGAGSDTVVLNGDYSAGLTLKATTMVNVETLDLAAGHSYKLTTNDANVGAGQTLTVDGSALGASDVLTVNGSAELDGNLIIKGGAGNDVLTGGAFGNTLTGGGGADILKGGVGDDVFVYSSAADSTSTGFDTVSGFDTTLDKFQVAVAVTGIDAAVASGQLDAGTFDTDLTNALNGHLLAGHAIVFTPTTGSFGGQTFLIVDQNGQAGYQAGGDLVIDLTSAHHLGALSTADFIT